MFQAEVDGEREEPWASGESGVSNGQRDAAEEEGEEPRLHEAPGDGQAEGGEKGARWMWGDDWPGAQGQPSVGEEEDEEGEEEENNNSSNQQEEGEERTEGGRREDREEEEEEEDEEEEEMDQDSDDFEQSESGREEEEEEEEEDGEGEDGLRSPSLRNNLSVHSLDSGRTHQSSPNKKKVRIRHPLLYS